MYGKDGRLKMGLWAVASALRGRLCSRLFERTGLFFLEHTFGKSF